MAISIGVTPTGSGTATGMVLHAFSVGSHSSGPSSVPRPSWPNRLLPQQSRLVGARNRAGVLRASGNRGCRYAVWQVHVYRSASIVGGPIAKLTVAAGAPAFDPARTGDRASVVPAGGDFAHASEAADVDRRGAAGERELPASLRPGVVTVAELTTGVVAPAFDRACAHQRAGVGITGGNFAHADAQSSNQNGDGAASDRIFFAGEFANFRPCVGPNPELAVVVPTPALRASFARDCARVSGTGIDPGREGHSPRGLRHRDREQAQGEHACHADAPQKAILPASFDPASAHASLEQF